MECSICLSDICEDQGMLKCTHTFCHPCISEWLLLNNSCPMCREPSKEIIHLSSSIPDLLNCLYYLGFKYVFVSNIDNISNVNTHKNTSILNINSRPRCFYCPSYYGLLTKCINTKTCEIEEIHLCSLCTKRLVYKNDINDVIGDFNLFIEKLTTRYENKELPSNYNLLDYFYKKDINYMKKAIDNLMIDWIVSKHCMDVDTADRFYEIISSCLPDNYNDKAVEMFDYLAHKIGPFVFEWHKSKLLKKCLKGLHGDVFGYHFDINSQVNIKMYIKFLYGLHHGTFKHLKWYCDYNDFWVNTNISKLLS
jgi:hypothetical protein